jgi:hypothetical protein
MAVKQQDPGYGQKKELANLGLGAKTIDGSSGRQPGRPTGRPTGATAKKSPKYFGGKAKPPFKSGK